MPLFRSRVLVDVSFEGSDVERLERGFLLTVMVCFVWFGATLVWATAVVGCMMLCASSCQRRFVSGLYIGFDSSSDSLVVIGVLSFKLGLLIKLGFVGVDI